MGHISRLQPTVGKYYVRYNYIDNISLDYYWALFLLNIIEIQHLKSFFSSPCITTLGSVCKNPILRDKCWVKGKIASLRKPAILGGRWTHVPKNQLPTLQVLLRNFIRKSGRDCVLGGEELLFSEMIISTTWFQVAFSYCLLLEHYLTHKSLFSYS